VIGWKAKPPYFLRTQALCRPENQYGDDRCGRQVDRNLLTTHVREENWDRKRKDDTDDGENEYH
jgi:hypothetical protein